MRPPTGQIIFPKEFNSGDETTLGDSLDVSLVNLSKNNINNIKLKNHPLVKKLNKKYKISTIIAFLILTLFLDQKIPISMMKKIYFEKYEINKGDQNPNFINLILNLGVIIGAPMSILALKKLSPNAIFTISSLTLAMFSLLFSFDYLDFPSFLYLYCPAAGFISGVQLVLPLYLIWRFGQPQNKGFICGLLMFVFKVNHYVVVRFLVVDTLFGKGLKEPTQISNFDYKWNMFHLGSFVFLVIFGVLGSFMIKKPITNDDLLKISPQAFQELMQKTNNTIRETFRDKEFSSINYFWRNRVRVTFIENPPLEYLTESLKIALKSSTFYNLLIYIFLSSLPTPILNCFCKSYLEKHYTIETHYINTYSSIDILSSFFFVITAVATYKNGFFIIGILIIFSNIVISILSYLLIKFPQYEFLGLGITFLCKALIHSFPPFIMIVCDKFFNNAGLLVFSFYLSIYLFFQSMSMKFLDEFKGDGTYFMKSRYYWILICLIPFFGLPWLYKLHKKLCIYSLK